jgi:hypothetical protein
VVSEDELNQYRVDGITVRVERDSEPANNVRGIVVAWDEDMVLLRKANRKLLKLSREYRYVPES